MKIKLDKPQTYEGLVQQISEKLQGKDASRYSLRADKKGNLSLVSKENFFRKALFRKGETERATSKVMLLVNQGTKQRYKGNIALGGNAARPGHYAMEKANLISYRSEGTGNYSIARKLPASELLGGALNREVGKLFNRADYSEKWNAYRDASQLQRVDPEKDTQELQAKKIFQNMEKVDRKVEYLNAALSLDEGVDPKSSYWLLCCNGSSQEIEASNLSKDGLDRPILFKPASANKEDNPWFQIETPKVRNVPKISYQEPNGTQPPKDYNEIRAHSFDKFRIGVHPEDMDKAFAIVWKHIGADMCTSGTPSIYAFKVHDMAGHEENGKTAKNHQFTLYLPLPDSLTEVYGERTEVDGDQQVTGDMVNQARCSQDQANKFCELMKDIERDFRQAGIRPSDSRSDDFNTDYNIPGSDYFSMRNEVLNDRKTSRTDQEKQVLSERQLPSMLAGVLAENIN